MKLKNKIVALFLTVACAFGLAVAGNTQRVDAAAPAVWDGFTALSGTSADGIVSYETFKGTASTAPALYSPVIRLYQNGGYITVSVGEDYELGSVTVRSAMVTSIAYTLDDSTEKSTTQSLSKDVKLTIDNLTASSISIYCMGTDKNHRFYINYLEVDYVEKNAAPKDDQTIFDEIQNGLSIDNEYYYDTTLPLEYKGATISWTSDNSAITISEGVASVVRGKEDVQVNLTASLTYAGSTEILTGSKVFGVTVKALNPNEPVVGTTYKLAVDQKALGTTIYFTGVKSGYNLQVSNSLSDAADIVFEDAIGGLYYSVNVGGTKKYLNLVAKDTYGNIYLDDAPSTVWEFNSQYNIMTATLSNGTFFLGTFNTNNDIRSSNISYASNSNNYLGYFVEASEITVEDQFESLNTMVQFGIDYATTETQVSGVSFYELVTDASELADGDTIIIVSSDEGYALSTNQKTNNRGQAIVVKEDDKINSIGEDVQVITLEDAGEGNFAFNVGEGYLYAANSSNNYLRTQETNDENGHWKITVEEGVTSIVAQGSNTRNVLQYNDTSDLFACYGSASQKQVSIYKLTTGSSILTSYSFNNAKLRFVGIIPAELAEYVDLAAGAGIVLTLADGRTQEVEVQEQGIVEEADGSLRFAVVLNVPADQYDTEVTGQAFVYLNDASSRTLLQEKTFSVNSIVDHYIANASDLGLGAVEIAVLNAFKAA